MGQSDSAFTGSIPQVYEECLVPVLFEPYARDITCRAVTSAPRAILEVAAGTGVLTGLLAEALPDSRILATDLNPAMIEIAQSKRSPPQVSYEVADAQELHFHETVFDLVICQFGVMFFPDRIAAYREARRVLRPGGRLLFNVWDRLEANLGSQAIHHAVRAAVPDPKPEFIARTPFGYNDRTVIEAELHSAGFAEVTIEQVEKSSPPGDAARLARGMCLGSPLANELAQHPQALRDLALDVAIEAVQAQAKAGPLTMSALVISASG